MGGFNNNTSKRILDELETVYLRLRNIEVERVGVIEFRVNNGGGDGTTCCEIKIRTKSTKLTNVRTSASARSISTIPPLRIQA